MTLLHNNDGDSDLLEEEIGGRSFGGIDRFATLVDNLREGALMGDGRRGVILASSGDNFLAGSIFTASMEKGVPFFDYIALDLIGYHSITIGNHEFDFGPDVLADFIEGFASPPFLTANLN